MENFGQISRNYKKESSGNSEMENMTEVKNWMDLFNTRIEIAKKKTSDRISNPDISEETTQTKA